MSEITIKLYGNCEIRKEYQLSLNINIYYILEE